MGNLGGTLILKRLILVWTTGIYINTQPIEAEVWLFKGSLTPMYIVLEG